MTAFWENHIAATNKIGCIRKLTQIADGLAIALAISLPWSTSATGIIAALWLITLVPTLNPTGLLRVLATPAGSLPVLLWALGLFGMFWSDAQIMERLGSFGDFHKLLCIPLLMAQFERSDKAPLLLTGFVGSCCLLLFLSFILAAFPNIPWQQTSARGVPVKDYIAQSALFTICIFLLMERAHDKWQRSERALSLCLIALAGFFLVNILSVSVSRTGLVVLPLVLLLMGFRYLGLRGAMLSLIGLVVISAAAWTYSPRFQLRVSNFATEVRDYLAMNRSSSAGARLEFWKKSTTFVLEAPFLGHGTGSTAGQFRKAAIEGSAHITSNPHNQVLAVGVQLGLVGIAVLVALWIAGLRLFWGLDFVAWAGFIVVVQNIVSSQFNSHLFDFTHGWTYVIGVGVCGGDVLKRRLR